MIEVFPKLTEVKVLSDYKLRLTYSDSAEGIFDFAKIVGFKGMFAKLKDPKEFQKAMISDNVWKNLTWPGELDLDPVMLYHTARPGRALIGFWNRMKPSSRLREH